MLPCSPTRTHFNLLVQYAVHSNTPDRCTSIHTRWRMQLLASRNQILTVHVGMHVNCGGYYFLCEVFVVPLAVIETAIDAAHLDHTCNKKRIVGRELCLC